MFAVNWNDIITISISDDCLVKKYVFRWKFVTPSRHRSFHAIGVGRNNVRKGRDVHPLVVFSLYGGCVDCEARVGPIRKVVAASVVGVQRNQPQLFCAGDFKLDRPWRIGFPHNPAIEPFFAIDENPKYDRTLTLAFLPLHTNFRAEFLESPGQFDQSFASTKVP
jgi:hypothetical protein